MNLYIDLQKAVLNKSKLVPKKVQVHGQHGMHMAIRWVNPDTGEEGTPHPHDFTQAPARIKEPEQGEIDHSKMHVGTKVTDHPNFQGDFESSNETLDDIGEQERGIRGHDSKKIFNNIFSGASKEHIESVFSHPQGNFKAKIDSIDVYYTGPKEDSFPVVSLNMTLHDGESDSNIGGIYRRVGRRSDGTIMVHNDELWVDEEYQKSGMADHIYRRSEAFWNHLSHGFPVHIEVGANISVGVYAWAKKGFDFASDEELQNARLQLRRFILDNGIDVQDMIEACGYNDMKELQHAEQFASLNDGEEYKLRSRDYPKEISGYGHFGKAFMLGGKTAWEGVKTLNIDKSGDDNARG